MRTTDAMYGVGMVLAGWGMVILVTLAIAYAGGTLEAWAHSMTRLLAAVGVLG